MMQRPCWTLKHATEGVGKTYPQHQTMGDGYDYDALNSVHKLPYDSLPTFQPNFKDIIIHNQAELTDLISSAPIRNTGYLVSARLRGVLEQFSLPLHHFYPVPTVHRGKAIDGYFWLQLPQPSLPLTEDMSIEAAEELIASTPEIAALDLLRLYRPERFAYCFISNRLRLAMEEAKVTGVRFGTSRLFRATVS